MLRRRHGLESDTAQHGGLRAEFPPSAGSLRDAAAVGDLRKRSLPEADAAYILIVKFGTDFMMGSYLCV